MSSVMLPLGTQAPNFSLKNVANDSTVTMHQHRGEHATVIMFICNHCPYVKHIHDELLRLGHDYKNKGVQFIAINSNDVQSYPEDSPENMKRLAIEHSYPFPYLFDATQEVAKAYQAACTPDFFVFDKDLALVYRGQLDDSRPGNNISVDGSSLRAALERLIQGELPLDVQKPSLGCSIKWKD